jgi:hypothetical protein
LSYLKENKGKMSCAGIDFEKDCDTAFDGYDTVLGCMKNKE